MLIKTQEMEQETLKVKFLFFSISPKLTALSFNK